MKLHLVIFHSEGEPYDKGLAINNISTLIDVAKNEVDNVSIYTPRILKSMGFGEYVKEYENQGLVKKNPGMKNIGFCAWRPLIIKLELDKVSEGDVVVYRDCNYHKYPGLLNYNNFRETCLKFLDICKFDFFVLRQNENILLKYYCKTNILRELCDNHPFSYDFPLLMSCLVAVRKSTISEELNNEWLENCKIERYIDGNIYGELLEGFKWSTPEQSILTAIISNWIRKHKIPFEYPNVLSNRSFKYDKIKHPKNFSYLQKIL